MPKTGGYNSHGLIERKPALGRGRSFEWGMVRRPAKRFGFGSLCEPWPLFRGPGCAANLNQRRVITQVPSR